MKNIYFIIISLISLFYVLKEIRSNNLPIKESFWWIILCFIMIYLSIFPYAIDKLALFLNIEYGPSILFLICSLFLLFINFRNSKKIAEMQNEINDLTQNIAIMEKKLNDKKRK